MLVHTSCPLGGSPSADRELYPATCDPTALSPELFHARRAPDRVHYRMVRNLETGTIRADPILQDDAITALYARSRRADPCLAEAAARTYVELGARVLPLVPDRRGLLDVGCGEGHFLEAAARWGMDRLVGVDPALVAREAGRGSRSFELISEPLRRGLFEPEAFSLITGFQVLDHLARPVEALEVCRDALCPGGVMFWVCHDVSALIPRLLGRHCPMVDVQHLVLYSRRTARAIMEKVGFEVIEVFSVANTYPLEYWLTLAPLPRRAREGLLCVARRLRIDHRPLRARLGNLGIVARKPVP